MTGIFDKSVRPLATNLLDMVDLGIISGLLLVVTSAVIAFIIQRGMIWKRRIDTRQGMHVIWPVRPAKRWRCGARGEIRVPRSHQSGRPAERRSRQVPLLRRKREWRRSGARGSSGSAVERVHETCMVCCGQVGPDVAEEVLGREQEVAAEPLEGQVEIVSLHVGEEGLQRLEFFDGLFVHPVGSLSGVVFSV